MDNEEFRESYRFREGQEAYIRYLGGLAIVAEPHVAFSQGVSGYERVDDSNREAILLHSETLMYSGLRRLITAAHPDSYDAEQQFASTIPSVRSMVDAAFETYGDRIDQMNPALRALRPLPIAQEPIYKAVCHSRLGKLYTVRLLDGFMPHASFGDIQKRTLAATHTKDS